MRKLESFHSRRVTINDYEPPARIPGHAYGIAHFLNWAADMLPGQVFSYPEIARVVLRRTRIPSAGSDDVLKTRRAIARTRYILMDKFHRGLVTGAGARATIDDADLVKTEFRRKVHRVHSATNALIKVTALIDENKLPLTSEFRAEREWFLREKKGLVKLLSSKQFQDMLVPPEPIVYLSKEA